MVSQSNKEILTQLIERKAGNILNSTDDIILSLFRGNPAISKIAQNVVNLKKKEYLPKIQEYCDLLVETSCLDPNITIEQAVENAESSLNELVNRFLSDQLGVDQGIVQISLRALFGEALFRL